jgi:predicted AAA+ superfamily ATPase
MPITTVPLCQRPMDDTRHCGSPAMRGKRYCYYHQRQYEQSIRITGQRARQPWFESVALDDRNAIQNALRQVMQRLASGEIEFAKAGLMLNQLRAATEALNTAEEVFYFERGPSQ